MCARRTEVRQNSYGFPTPYKTGAPTPIVSNRVPTSADKGETGQLWIDVLTSQSWINVGTLNGITTWTLFPGAPTPAQIINYAEFYGLTTGTGNGGANDYAATVAVKTAAGTGRVPFPRAGAASGNIVAADATSFTIPTIGTYEVTFRVHTTEHGQLQLELNGTAVDKSTAVNMNPTAGGHPIIGNCIITTVAINSVLAVINPAGNSTALTVTPSDGADTHANAQSITIKRLS